MDALTTPCPLVHCPLPDFLGLAFFDGSSAALVAPLLHPSEQAARRLLSFSLLLILLATGLSNPMELVWGHARKVLLMCWNEIRGFVNADFPRTPIVTIEVVVDSSDYTVI